VLPDTLALKGLVIRLDHTVLLGVCG
jgi:hypothetical protein